MQFLKTGAPIIRVLDWRLIVLIDHGDSSIGGTGSDRGPRTKLQAHKSPTGDSQLLLTPTLSYRWGVHSGPGPDPRSPVMRPLLSLNWCHGVVLAPSSSTGCRFFRVHATSPLRESVQDHIGDRVLGNPNHRIVRPLDFDDDRQSCILSRCKGGLGPESPPNRGALLTMSAIEWSPPVICGLL